MTAVQVSNLIRNSSPALQATGNNGPVLDLACGSGRNGIHLVSQGQSVVFADRQQAKLDEIARHLQGNELATFWAVDLEHPERNPLTGRSFASILVFRYLHRPLMAAIKESVQPGGLVVYETFTVDQPRFGRPSNPEFLLRPEELEETFYSWEIIHSFEGVAICETSGREQAIAQIVARKPSDHESFAL
jgi:tellurite methyltransferase